MKYTIKDWLRVHEISFDQASLHCDKINDFCTSNRHHFANTSSMNCARLQICPVDAFEKYVLPVLKKIFGNYLELDALLSCVAFRPVGDLNGSISKTEVATSTSKIIITVPWSGLVENLLSLMHEYMHAIHIIYSKFKYVPPALRELCAFLGEKSLIDFLKPASPSLADSAQQIWRQQNEVYLGDNLHDLSRALLSRDAEYKYAFNYPFARFAALHFDLGEQSVRENVELFSSTCFGLAKYPEGINQSSPLIC